MTPLPSRFVPATCEPCVGPPGPPGPGGGNSFYVVAGQDLSGQRVVRPQDDGTVIYATNRDLGDATRALWLTLGAALDGDMVEVQAYGRVEEPGWSWVDGPIFLDDDGYLTQTPPAPPAVFFIQLASPDSPTALFYEPRTPYAI